MKKFFTLLFALAVSVGTALAEDGTCGENLTWDLTNGVLTISGTGDMTNFGYQGAPWYSFRESITSMTIENGVTSIGSFAFRDCTGLTSVTIPNSVTSIGTNAFWGCTGLTSVTIPNSVTSIGMAVFYCSNLTSPVYNAYVFAYMPTSYTGAYTIPDGIESIASSAFLDCSGLTSVTIPNSVTNIGVSAFFGCSGLTSPVCNSHIFAYMPPSYSGAYTIPNGIEQIAGSAFSHCSGLTSITIPNSVTNIGDYAFYDCSGLTSVICLGEVPPIMGDKVFIYQNPQDADYLLLPNLSSIYVPCGTLNTYKSSWQQYSNLIQNEPIPYTIEAYANNPYMGYIDYPQGSLTICNNPAILTAEPKNGYYFVQWADGNKDNPRTIDLTQDTTLEAIFDYLLEGKCGKDNALTWKLDTTKKALEITGKGALSENYTYGIFIESLTIGNEVTSIGQSAFYGFTNLKNIIIGSSVKVLEEKAFANCSSIETITCYSQRPPTVNTYALYGLDYSTIVYVPADFLNTYIMHDSWGLYDVRPLSNPTDPQLETGEYNVLYMDKNSKELYQESVLLHIPAAPEIEGFTFLRWETIAGDIENGITIQAIYEADDPSSTPDEVSVPGKQAQKLIRQGNVYILTDDSHTYTLTGQQLK